jgi:hypothetical protein
MLTRSEVPLLSANQLDDSPQEQLRVRLLQASWQRDKPIARRRIAKRWLHWFARHWAAPLGLVLLVALALAWLFGSMNVFHGAVPAQSLNDFDPPIELPIALPIALQLTRQFQPASTLLPPIDAPADVLALPALRLTPTIHRLEM